MSEEKETLAFRLLSSVTGPYDDREFGTDEGDNICPECDSTGEIDGRVCKNCQGKGYVQPPHSK